MTTYADPLTMIDSQLARATEPRPTGNKRPIFLFLKPGHKALIRPLSDLRGCVVLAKHNKFADDPTQRVNAICAKENDQECLHCAFAVNDKKLTANVVFYLPIWIYKVTDQNTGAVVTYKERDDAGNEVEKPLAGVRLIELSGFGTIGSVLKLFRSYMREAEEENEPGMTERDFSFEQVGSGTGKSFNVIPKQPKPANDNIKKAMAITAVRFRDRILEALPPTTTTSTTEKPSNVTPISAANKQELVNVDEIPEF